MIIEQRGEDRGPLLRWSDLAQAMLAVFGGGLGLNVDMDMVASFGGRSPQAWRVPHRPAERSRPSCPPGAVEGSAGRGGREEGAASRPAVLPASCRRPWKHGAQNPRGAHRNTAEGLKRIRQRCTTALAAASPYMTGAAARSSRAGRERGGACSTSRRRFNAPSARERARARAAGNRTHPVQTASNPTAIVPWRAHPAERGGAPWGRPELPVRRADRGSSEATPRARALCRQTS